MSLPKRFFRIAGELVQGLYDEENGQFYLTDSSGKLLNKMVTIPKSTEREPDPVDSLEPSDSESDVETEGMPMKRGIAKLFHMQHNRNVEDDTPRTSRKMTSFVTLAVIVVIAGALFTTNLLPRLGGHTSIEDPNVPLSDAPYLDKIEVVQVIRDMIPGDVITPDDIQSTTISSESFSQITLSGVNIYKWDRCDQLLNKYITSYVPAGQYLAYDKVSSTVTLPANPWTTAKDGYMLVKVPIDPTAKADALMNFGTVMNMEIQKQTVSQTPTGDADGDKAEVDGLEHTTTVEQSVIIDKYTMENLVICDILNAAGESLYNTYNAYMGIPAGEQFYYISNALSENAELEETLTPEYVLVSVTDEQAQALGDLTGSGIAVRFYLTEGTGGSDGFIANARAMRSTIDEAIAYNAEKVVPADDANVEPIEE